MAEKLSELDALRLNAMKKIVRAVRRKRIETFVSIGASAKPTALFFQYVWKATYPKKDPPLVVHLGQFIRRDQILKLYSDANVGKKLLQYKSILKEKINGRIMLFDELARSGTTLRLAKRIFERAGARNLTTAALFANKRLSIADPFFPGESLLMVKKTANVIGRVERSLKRAEKASYWKNRDLNAVNAHLKEVAKHASRKRLFRKRK